MRPSAFSKQAGSPRSNKVSKLKLRPSVSKNDKEILSQKDNNSPRKSFKNDLNLEISLQTYDAENVSTVPKTQKYNRSFL